MPQGGAAEGEYFCTSGYFCSSRWTGITHSYVPGCSAQLWAQGIMSGWAVRAGISAAKPLLTLYSQQRVPVAAGYGGHQVWMRLLQLHRPRRSRFLVLPAQASPGSFPPGAHLAVCRGTQLAARRAPGGLHQGTASPPPGAFSCLNQQRGLQAQGSQGLLQPSTRGFKPHLLRWPR